MRLLGYVFLACLLITILRAIIIALCVAFAFMLLWGALFRPQATFGLMVMSACVLALQTYPFASLGIAIAVLLLNSIAQRAPERPGSTVQQLEHRDPDQNIFQQDGA